MDIIHLHYVYLHRWRVYEDSQIIEWKKILGARYKKKKKLMNKRQKKTTKKLLP